MQKYHCSWFFPTLVFMFTAGKSSSASRAYKIQSGKLKVEFNSYLLQIFF